MQTTVHVKCHRLDVRQTRRLPHGQQCRQFSGFPSANLYSHAVAMMNTLADGITTGRARLARRRDPRAGEFVIAGHICRRRLPFSLILTAARKKLAGLAAGKPTAPIHRGGVSPAIVYTARSLIRTFLRNHIAGPKARAMNPWCRRAHAGRKSDHLDIAVRRSIARRDRRRYKMDDTDPVLPLAFARF